MTRLNYASIACVVVATGFLAYAASQPSYIDPQGFVVEPFAWEASGRVLLAAAAIFGGIDLIRRALRRSKPLLD